MLPFLPEDTLKIKHIGTQGKTYVPTLAGKPLRISWGTKTKALLYAKMVKYRYYKKLAVHIRQLEEQRKQQEAQDAELHTGSQGNESPASQ